MILPPIRPEKEITKNERFTYSQLDDFIVRLKQRCDLWKQMSEIERQLKELDGDYFEITIKTK